MKRDVWKNFYQIRGKFCSNNQLGNGWCSMNITNRMWVVGSLFIFPTAFIWTWNRNSSRILPIKLNFVTLMLYFFLCFFFLRIILNILCSKGFRYRGKNDVFCFFFLFGTQLGVIALKLWVCMTHFDIAESIKNYWVKM